jgi:PEP-CTERM motif
LASQSARADEITVAGATSSNPPSGISFLPGSFSGTTSGGFAGFSNLGSYSLSSTPGSYSGTVSLVVTFSLPTGIVGGGTSTFTATLVGNVSTNSTGGVDITFSNPTQTFTFSNSNGSGSFTFTVNPVSVNPGGTTAVSGYVTGGVFTPAPEPSSILLLGVGLLAASLALKRPN